MDHAILVYENAQPAPANPTRSFHQQQVVQKLGVRGSRWYQGHKYSQLVYWRSFSIPVRFIAQSVDNAYFKLEDAMLMTMSRRFLTLADVTEVLNISSAQAYALVRSGDLPAIQVGGRGQWRVEESELDAYIDREYAKVRERFAAEDAQQDANS